jgi:hypothetical protein
MSTVKLSFLGVQPINISDRLYLKLLTKKVSFSKLDNIKDERLPFEWMDKYRSIYDTYRDLYEWDISETTKDLLVIEPSLNMDNELLYLSEYLNKCEAKLYFDPRFVYFILVYQINFEIPFRILIKFLDYDPTKNNTKYKDLYNSIRKAIVREEPQSKISIWGQGIQDKAVLKIKEIIKYLYNEEIDKNDINITENSCNITNIVRLPELKQEQEFIKKLISLNIYAERLTSELQIEPLYNGSVYFSFNGRFHTVILKNEQDKYRFQPLQFHIQYMWFLVEYYIAIMNKINKSLMETDSLKVLQKYSMLIHTIINKIELLSLHNMNFKHSIEIDIEIYEENERRWSISSLLESSKQYVSFFKDYLDRLFNQKNAMYQKKMNLILLGISFLQLFALISVWNDYLSTLDINNLNIDGRIMYLFGNVKANLLTFNLYVPIVLIIFMIGVLIYLWKHRIK